MTTYKPLFSDEDLRVIRSMAKTLGKHRAVAMVSLIEQGDPTLVDEHNPAGSSRPHLDNRPVSWSAGMGPELGVWDHIHSQRARAAEVERLCIMCGLPLDSNYVYANYGDRTYDRVGVPLLGEPPIPTFTHPRCLLQAAAFCPFLKNLTHPGLDRNGRKLSRDDLRKLSN